MGHSCSSPPRQNKLYSRVRVLLCSQMQMFCNRLGQNKIGYDVYGLFVIERSTILMVRDSLSLFLSSLSFSIFCLFFFLCSFLSLLSLSLAFSFSLAFSLPLLFLSFSLCLSFVFCLLYSRSLSLQISLSFPFFVVHFLFISVSYLVSTLRSHSFFFLSFFFFLTYAPAREHTYTCAQTHLHVYTQAHTYMHKHFCSDSPAGHERF